MKYINNWLREGLIVPYSEGKLSLSKDATSEKNIVVDLALSNDSESINEEIEIWYSDSIELAAARDLLFLYNIIHFIQTT